MRAEVVRAYRYRIGNAEVGGKGCTVAGCKEEAKAAATAIAAKLPKNEEVRQLLSKAGAAK
jgi:hypothetical protein